MREIVRPASAILCAGGIGVAPSSGVCAILRAAAGVAPLTRATSARAANSVIVFIGLASVCNYTKTYDWRRDRTVMLVTISALGAGPRLSLIWLKKGAVALAVTLRKIKDGSGCLRDYH